MKKFYLLSFLLTIALQASAQVWDGIAATTWTTGDGTVSNPYLIETPSQLAYLSKRVGNGDTFENQYFRLTNDLNMSDKEFPIIGKYDKSTDPKTNETTDNSLYFKGVFDGNHKAIDHLLITKAPAVTGSIAGQPVSLGGVALFACTANSSIIRNVTIGEHSKINVDGEIIGSIIGVMEGGLLENSVNLCTVSATTFGGGLVGYATGTSTIQYCANKGSVSATGMICGGIVSQMDKTATVRGCYNVGTVTGKSYFVGGIVGITYDGVTVKNCYETGKVTAPKNFMSTPHAIIGENDKNTAVWADNYYVEALSGVKDDAATALTEAELQADDAIVKLNHLLDIHAFVSDSRNINRGFPILAWEQPGVTGITSATTEGNIVVNGRSIIGRQTVTVRDISGRVVAVGTDISLQEAGIYLVSAGKQPTMKVVVR